MVEYGEDCSRRDKTSCKADKQSYCASPQQLAVIDIYNDKVRIILLQCKILQKMTATYLSTLFEKLFERVTFPLN